MLVTSPSMLKTSVRLLLQENVFSPEEFMHELAKEYSLSIEPEEVEYLLGLPEGTLSIPKIINFRPLQLKNS